MSVVTALYAIRARHSGAVDAGRSRPARPAVTVAGRLAAYTDSALATLVEPVRAASIGGASGVIDVGDVPVFVKRIPLTRRELDHPGSTANLFDLPLYCQYGFGGPSFNAWRELAANQIVTAAEPGLFPRLYHWRVLPGRPPSTVAGYGQADPLVHHRLDELATAPAGLVLFLEYVRYPLQDWLDADPAGRASTLEQQLAQIVGALRQHELLHMDGHFGNMRSDGHRIYLTDFGLATSPRFELSAPEREFAARHAGHDADYAAMRLVNWIVTRLRNVPVPTDGSAPVARNEYVRRCAEGDIPPGPAAAVLARHAPAAARMNALYRKLFGGDIHAEYGR
ncbi:serine/threonine protein phosphatase [Actinoplanes sp. NPDC051411]|uniref:serine/threonine protein phosphatase n=1 Tax=Actinoplanes sp. NPDC051411 TaxID=3155522 RepID=UPI0034261F05